MAQAFVLINCELGSEEQIISELKTFSDVKEVQGTFGAYDIIAEINAEDWEGYTADGSVVKGNAAHIEILDNWFNNANANPKWEVKWMIANAAKNKEGIIEQWLTTGNEYTDVDAVVENIFKNEQHELVCSNNGEAFHFVDAALRMQTDITGPIQHATWDSSANAWRICGWRKEVLLLDQPTTSDYSEIPMHCLEIEGQWWNLFNDGNWKLSNL